MSAEPRFRTQPDASQLVEGLVSEVEATSPEIVALSRRLLDTTGSRLADAIEVVGAPQGDALGERLRATGFVKLPPEATPQAHELWEHPGALLPLLSLSAAEKLKLYVRVESVVDFLEANDLTQPPCFEGEPGALVRRAQIFATESSEIWVAERLAERRLIPGFAGVHEGVDCEAIQRHLEAFRLRPRPYQDAEAGFLAAIARIEAAKRDLGPAVTCQLFFQAERARYLRTNRAARVQKARQDALGLGFFNADHHTYRSSRACFRSLIKALETMGLECRERFYAGHEAGWGAQVLEHQELGICVFADVDLSPEELSFDFAHQGLEQRPDRGTVGLWCELHGEAFLAAGMHHLECQFDFATVRAQLEAQGVPVMPPFTDFPHLKQAFTEGELWCVPPDRIEQARAAGFLTSEQADRLAREGALGSHFEILERNQGYKGFNQSGINRIIEATDPRHEHRGALKSA